MTPAPGELPERKVLGEFGVTIQLYYFFHFFVLIIRHPPLVMSSVVETSLSEIHEISPLTTFGRDDNDGLLTFLFVYVN